MTKRNDGNPTENQESNKQLNFPKVVMFYGPPGSGKGTQANLLKEKYGFRFLDWGHEFRHFSNIHLNDKTDPEYWRAKRVQEYMLEGLPILTEDLQYIIGQSIVDGALNRSDTFVMDKCGVKIGEAQWLSNLLHQNNILNILFHLPLSLEDAIERISNRYYAPNDKKPYNSYGDALAHCAEGMLPIKRKDEDRQTTMARYDNLYRIHHLEILDTYKNTNYTHVIDIDASQNISDVHDIIIEKLESFQKS